MSRQPIREMKRQLSVGSRPTAGAAQQGLARESALALLERSIHFGHDRLAVIRLSIAVQAGVTVPSPHWAYCEAALRDCPDPALLELWRGATEMASRSRLNACGFAA